MKKILAILALVIGSLNCLAQTNNQQPTPGVEYLSSPNLIPAGTTAAWSNTVIGSAGGYSGGSTAAYNPSTNTIIFGYTQQTVAYNYAFSQALQNAGLAIGGYNYSWKINNNDSNTGTLSGKFTLKSLNGTALQTYNYTYNDKTTGDSENFQLFTGTQWFPKNYSSAEISSFSMEWTGKDDRYWAGYYGPRVRDPSIQLRYLVDICASNPLSSPDCPGYAEAYKQQQCSISPLYDASCPGYAEALKTSQCRANSLSYPDCPGYAEAYKTYQCTINPLSFTDCPGYAEAYFKDQCIKDSLYDKKCEGYATAYAIKYLTPSIDPAAANAVNQQLTTNVEIAKADPAKVTVVSSTIDSVITAPATTSATSVTSVTSVVLPPPPPPGTSAAITTAATPPPPPPPAKQEEKAQDQKRNDAEVAKVERKAEGKPADAKRGVEQRAKDIAQQAAKAATLEAQAAQQGLLVGLMGYVPGFSAYQQSTIPDSMAIEVARKYSKPVVDNVRAQRVLRGASDRMHQEMVNSQYRNIE